MTSAIRRLVLSSAALAAGLLVSTGHAQAPLARSPQNGIWQNGNVNFSRSSSAAGAPSTTATESHKSTGASSWSAGRGDFGAQNTVPVATKNASNGMGSTVAPSSGSSSWTAGRGSFGATGEQQGIWRDRAGLLRSQGAGSPRKPASGLYAPFARPNFTGTPSAFAPMRTPSARAAVPRSMAGAHGGSRTRQSMLSQASKTPRGSTSGRTGTKSAAKGLRGRSSPQSRGRTMIGVEMKPSPPSSTTQAPEQ